MARTALLFPGQGAQAVGMGRSLCESVPAARRLFDEASEILGYDLALVCFDGPAERLESTVVSQPAIFVASLAALEALRAGEPAAVDGCEAAAGLSLGEYTALVFAGALGFADGLRVVKRRGEAMQAAADVSAGGMVSVLGLERSAVEELCAAARGPDVLEVANLLCPGNVAVSGDAAACGRLERLAMASGAKAVRLKVAGAFHTSRMKPADRALEEALAGVVLQPPRVPVWSNVDARPHTDPVEIRQLLVRQVLQPVRWEETLRGMMAEGMDRFYEVGPGRVLTGLLKRVQRKGDYRNVSA